MLLFWRYTIFNTCHDEHKTLIGVSSDDACCQHKFILGVRSDFQDFLELISMQIVGFALNSDLINFILG